MQAEGFAPAAPQRVQAYMHMCLSLMLCVVSLPAAVVGSRSRSTNCLSGNCAAGFTVGVGCPLSTARDAARACRRGENTTTQLLLLAGNHRVVEPLVLDHRDSWSMWRGEPGAVISGGVDVGGWSTSESPLLTAMMPATLTRCPRWLFINGVRVGRTSHPLNSTVAGMDGNGSDAALRLTDTGFETSSSAPLAWPEPTNVELRHDSAFMQSRCGVRNVSALPGGTGAAVWMAQPCWKLGTALGQMAATTSARYPGAVENIGLGLRPGQFNCSLQKRTLTYHPKSDMERIAMSDPSPTGRLDVVAPAADGLFVVTGAQSLTFSQLTFSTTTYGEHPHPLKQSGGGPMSNDGYLERYGGIRYLTCDSPEGSGVCYRTKEESCAAGCCGVSGGCKLKMSPAALDFRSCKEVTVTDCMFKQLGSWGIGLKHGTADSQVVRSVFSDLSGGAVFIGNVNETRTQDPLAAGDPSPQPTNITVADNIIENVSVEFKGSSGLHVFSAVDTAVMHNRMRDIGYTAITFNWPCPQNESYSRNMSMQGNDVANYSTWGTDGGAVHTLGFCHDCVMDRNYFHDTPCCGSKVTYIDSASSGYLTQNHVVDNCGDALWLYYQQGCGPSAAGGMGCPWNPKFQTYDGCNATNHSKCCCNNGIDNRACPAAAPCWMRRTALDPFPIVNITAFHHLNDSQSFPPPAAAIIEAAGPRHNKYHEPKLATVLALPLPTSDK